MIVTAAFVLLMVILIRFSEEKFWLISILLLGLVVQCGVHIGTIQIGIWLGITKVLRDLCCGIKSS